MLKATIICNHNRPPCVDNRAYAYDKKIVYSAIILMMFLVPLVGLWSEGVPETPQEEQVSVTVQVGALKGPTGIGMIKLFRDHPEVGPNYGFEFSVIQTPPDMVARITSQEIDIAVLPVNVAANLYSNGPGYKLAAVVGLGMLYLVSDQTLDWDDIKDKQIYCAGKGATPDYLFRYLAQAKGLKPEQDFELLFTYPPTQMAQMFIAGRINRVVLPEPFVSQILMKKKDAEIGIDLQQTWRKVQNSDTAYPMSVVVISPEIIQKHTDMIGLFLSAYEKSINWVKQNPQEAGALVEKYGIMPAGPATAAVPRCNLIYQSAWQTREQIADFLKVLFSFAPEAIGGALPDDGFYYQE